MIHTSNRAKQIATEVLPTLQRLPASEAELLTFARQLLVWARTQGYAPLDPEAAFLDGAVEQMREHIAHITLLYQRTLDTDEYPESHPSD